MSTTEIIDMHHWQLFKGISLDELNHTSALLTRKDNKYIVDAKIVHEALPLFALEFDILEINNIRLFNYESCYFDDADLRSYFDHHQGRRQRFKIRTRKYVESNVCFIEVKLKNCRGITIKKRMPYTTELFNTLNQHAIEYLNQEYHSFYGKHFSNELAPRLHVAYERATLVSKKGGERVTIDNNIHFKNNTHAFATNKNTYVIETKSINGNGIADAILRKLHQHPSNNCSKYCMGMYATQQVNRFNTFMPTLRKLGIIAT